MYPEVVKNKLEDKSEEGVTKYDRPAMSNAYIEPESTTEKVLCELLQEFFGISQIGIEDDFFELGGDSLKAMTIISRIHQRFNIELQIREIMQHANVKKLAGEIDLRKKMNEMREERSTISFENKIEL